MIIDFEKADSGTFTPEEINKVNSFIKTTTFSVSKHAIEMFFTRYLNAYSLAFKSSMWKMENDVKHIQFPKLIRSYAHFKEVYNLYGWNDLTELSNFINYFLKEHGEYKVLTQLEKRMYKMRDERREHKTLKIVAEPRGMFVKFVFIIDVKSKTIITVEILHSQKSAETLNSTKTIKEEVDYFFHHNTFEEDLKRMNDIRSHEDYCKYPKEPNNRECVFNYLFSTKITIPDYLVDMYLIKFINNLSKSSTKFKPRIMELYEIYKSSLQNKKDYFIDTIKDLKLTKVSHISVGNLKRRRDLLTVEEAQSNISFVFDLESDTLINVKGSKINVPYFSKEAREILSLGEDIIRGVQVIVLNHEGKLLIAKRSKFKKNGELRIGAERWNFVGGKLDSNETPKMAAIRETLEESGIRLSCVKYLHEEMNNWDPLYDPFYAYLFAGQISKDVQVILNEEHSEYKFISFNDIDDYNLLGYTRDELSDIILK